ncbi:MAG: 3-deoxy-D-manno-octulosonic acid transferase [Bacteroidales bacterium]|nr:3-deoxy-D-manno-octulosonic acid transferase [Bacteroidales bacterium]
MLFRFFYSIGIRGYAFLVWLASFFNPKAKLWIKGRKNIFAKISQLNIASENVIWFHVSSLGEFEQARPLIEKIKRQNTSKKILITFFSPSGYEIRKNYESADYVFYLPVDTKKNANLFLKLINPSLVFFVKYDFWVNYIQQIHKKNIPLFLVSGVFRRNQIFFKRKGKKYAEVLKCFNHFFVQDKESLFLLKNIGIETVTIAGDTRFDRVIEISEKSVDFNIIEEFAGNSICFVAGSTWPSDEKIISQFINSNVDDIKFIIAPHNIEENRIIDLLQLLNKKVVRYSKANLESVSEYQVLIIDNIGMLASIYKYGKIAYIGGGFGAGIHNILEAAVYGMPVIFGPNFKKFNEAKDLIELKAAFSITDSEEFNTIVKTFLSDLNFISATSEKAKNYVCKNKGASQVIMEHVFK